MKTFKQIEQSARKFYPEWAKAFDPANILGLTDRENTMVAFATDFCEHEMSRESTSQRWIPVEHESKLVKDIPAGTEIIAELVGISTGKVVYAHIKRVDETDCSWRTADDDSELAPCWQITRYMTLPDKPIINPPSGEK